MVLSTKENTDWHEEVHSVTKQFTKRGMIGNNLIGRLVTVDFHRPFEQKNLLSGIASIEEVPEDSKNHFMAQKFFIITRIHKEGYASYAVLDGLYPVSLYRLRDERTGLHLFGNS